MINSDDLISVLHKFKTIDSRDSGATELKDFLVSRGVKKPIASNISTAWHQGAYNRDMRETIELINSDEIARSIYQELVKNITNRPT